MKLPMACTNAQSRSQLPKPLHKPLPMEDLPTHFTKWMETQMKDGGGFSKDIVMRNFWNSLSAITKVLWRNLKEIDEKYEDIYEEIEWDTEEWETEWETDVEIEGEFEKSVDWEF